MSVHPVALNALSIQSLFQADEARWRKGCTGYLGWDMGGTFEGLSTLDPLRKTYDFWAAPRLQRQRLPPATASKTLRRRKKKVRVRGRGRGPRTGRFEPRVLWRIESLRDNLRAAKWAETENTRLTFVTTANTVLTNGRFLTWGTRTTTKKSPQESIKANESK